MGFLKEVFRIAGIVAETAVYAVGTVAAWVGEKAVYLAGVARKAYNDYKQRNIPLEKRRNRSRLEDVNEQILDLQRKKRRDRSLNEYDQYELKRLKKERDRLIDESMEHYEAESAREIANSPGEFEDVEIDTSNLHIVQYHVGQTVSNKRCICGRPMILQWQRGTTSASSFHDFFWGCSGYYSGECNRKQPFHASDARYFTKTSRSEFQLTSKQLSSIALAPVSQQLIQTRMNRLRNEVIEKYLCPEHGVELVLKPKKDAEGLLDLYFLGCPHWTPGGEGCSYVMKLKSPAQLASVLETTTGKGLL